MGQKVWFTWLVLIVLILSGCGGGGGISNATNKSVGVFVDSNVSGLSYTTSSGLSGVTDENGGYRYNEGDTVTFSIGGITIGSCRATPYVTPMSIFPGNMEAAINLAQFLQTLDSDGDPSNGITPSEEIVNTFANIDNFDFESQNFDTVLQSNLPSGVSFVSEAQAMRHMEESFATLKINPDGSQQTTTKRVFVGADINHGFELWVTDGTKENSSLVKELVEGGTLSSSPNNFTKVGDKIFFTANDGSHGEELWVSDGSAYGTKMVKDIKEGSDGSAPYYLTAMGGVCYFRAETDENGYELWRSDGTSDGTYMVKDIVPGNNSSYIQNIVAVGNKLFFTARTDENGYELWKSDGTSDGTYMVKDIYEGGSSSFPYKFTVFNDTLFFIARTDEYGYELWKSDGTSDGTEIVKDIEDGDIGSYPSELTVNGDTLFFVAERGAIYGLWKSDGTTANTVLIKEWDFDGPSYLTVFNNKLYFAVDDGSEEFGKELWVSDGTSDGTYMVKDIYPGEYSSYVQYITATDDNLFFRAKRSSNSGYELWVSDGTSDGTTLVTDENNNTIKFPYSLRAVGDILYFTTRTDSNGRELWKSDGTSGGTTLVKDIYLGKEDSDLSHLTGIDSTLYFGANDGTYGKELWVSNGTSEGTTLFKDINKQPKSSLYPGSQFFKAGDKYYFKKENTLWVSDGTVNGTIALDSHPIEFERSVVFGDKFVYLVDVDDGYTLKVTDGTVKGTKAIFSGKIDSFTLTANSTNIYFSAREETSEDGPDDDSYNGYKIHKSDGTAEGTTIVTKSDGTDFEYPNYLTISEDNLFFTSGSKGSQQLYAINMTTNIATPLSEEGELYVRDLIDVNGTLFFRGENDTNGSELWKSDGTVDGTVLVKDIVSEEDSSYPEDFVNVNGTLYFTAETNEHGRELWRSDGTAEGTIMIKDIKDGSSSSNPRMVAVVDNKLYFYTYDENKSQILWVTYQDSNITGSVDLGVDMHNYRLIVESGFVPHYDNYLLLWLVERDRYNHFLLKKITGSVSETFQDVVLSLGDDDK